MNINCDNALRGCTSCQFCAAVCPKDAISIDLNEDGFYRPSVDNNKCIDCGLCVKQCYKFDSDVKCTTPSDDIELYAAYAKDCSIVRETTSGGIADILAKQLVNQGYVCIGVKYAPDENIAVGKCASCADETDAFRGSKYIQSYSVDAFRTLVKCAKGQKFAVFGLPCQIYAIAKWLNLKGIRSQHILIDLYCHGCPSIFAWHKYIDYVKAESKGNRILNATFRSKVKGWGNFCVAVVVDGVRKPFVSRNKKNYFYELFFSDKILNDSCYDCKLRSSLEYTDIRLGDFWGHAYVMNNIGVSGVTICSENGADLYRSIYGAIISMKHRFTDFYPYQSFGKNYPCDNAVRNKMLLSLSRETDTVRDTIAILRQSLSMTQKIKNLIKDIIQLMPGRVVSRIKYVYYSICGMSK